MNNIFIAMVLSDSNEEGYYSLYQTFCSTKSLEDIINISIDFLKQTPRFDPDDYIIEIKHYLLNYSKTSDKIVYEDFINKYEFATHYVNINGEISESCFGWSKDFIISDFTDPVDKFSIGDICEIYKTYNNKEYFGRGVITRQRTNPYNHFDNFNIYNPGYYLVYKTDDECHMLEDFGFGQEELVKIENCEDKWLNKISSMVKEGDYSFRNIRTFHEIIDQYA